MTLKKQRRAAKPSAVSLLMLRSREIGATEFKAHCLEVMDEVERLGIEVVITKHRRPVVRLLPARAKGSGFCGSLAGSVIDAGDLVSPIEIAWEADESNFA